MSKTGSKRFVIGGSVDLVDTPALVLDLDAFDRNVAAVAGILRSAGVKWRPHIKGLKVPALAHRLIAAGAVGITSAKVSEAEVMVAAGIGDVLVANLVVGELKTRRLAALARTATVTVAMDSPEHVRQAGAAARAMGVTLGVLIEIDIGLKRCGVTPGAAGADLAREIVATDGLEFRGVMGWEGHTQLVSDHAEKDAMVVESVHALLATAEACRAAGIETREISCGGSATYRHTALQPGVTEIQAGGVVLGDIFYETAGGAHELALTIHSTVVSRPAPDRIVTDAGRKTLAGDTAVPRPLDVGEVTRLRLAAEHGTIELAEPSETPRIGDRMRYVVGYADTTVCMHDVMYGVREGIVETAWEIAARGKLQ